MGFLESTHGAGMTTKYEKESKHTLPKEKRITDAERQNAGEMLLFTLTMWGVRSEEMNNFTHERPHC